MDFLKEQRVIRVFVSSTFRDMREERDILAKRIFPQLKKLCEERRVTWGEIDLRWGVTEEQKAEGKVLPICLEEINRCRPYFIGILGERYGWIPDAVPQDLIDREPWLKEHLHHSVTELEILHGVLNNPGMTEHAFFYFRDPDYLNHLPKNSKLSDYVSEEEASRDKLRDLKARIKKWGGPVQENYTDPRSLGELVLQDFTAVINQLYPADEKIDSLDRETLDHESFAQSRAQVYIGRNEYFERLDEQAQGQTPPLIVFGESGSGKSALLANWALRYQKEHPGEFILMHFIGASPHSADWSSLLRRIMEELKRRFHIRQDIPDNPQELRIAFAAWLHIAAVKGRIILVLDALNQLEDRDGALDLVWLPPIIPSNVRLILSTVSGRPWDDLQKRLWPVLTVKPLTQEERMSFIEKYLAQYTKALSRSFAERISTAEQTAIPIYLKILLEELRFFGKHEKLGQQIEHYLQAKNPHELYSKVLRRWEEDYESRPWLVGDSFSLIWGSRRGLSEYELLAMLGSQGAPLPHVDWSPLFLAARESLINRSGLLNFSHDFLREAVKNIYLATEEQQRAVHLRLADYFDKEEVSPRKVNELPWQISQGSDWRRLFDLFTDWMFLETAYKENPFEVKTYWTQIENRASLRMIDAYASILRNPLKNAAQTWITAQLFNDLGHSAEALSLQMQLRQYFQKNGDWLNYSKTLRSISFILKTKGDPVQALSMDEEAEMIYQRLGDAWEQQACLSHQGLILRELGQLDRALEKFNKAEKICEEIGAWGSVPYVLYGQGLVHKDRGELDTALDFFKRAERKGVELGDKSVLINALNSQAVIYRHKKDYKTAMEYHRSQEDISREIGDKLQMARSLGGQAVLHQIFGEFETAQKLYDEEIRISRELNDISGMTISLANQSTLLLKMNRMEESLKMMKDVEKNWRSLHNIVGLVTCLRNQAMHLIVNLDREEEALPLAEEAYRLVLQYGLAPLPKEFMRVLQALRDNYGS